MLAKPVKLKNGKKKFTFLIWIDNFEIFPKKTRTLFNLIVKVTLLVEIISVGTASTLLGKPN